MITFPQWVENPQDPELSKEDIEAQLGNRRLRFMVFYAAMHATPQMSLAALADTCNIERAHLHAAIRDGKCSPKMSTKIERACGRDVIRREWLMFPLEVAELTH